MYWDITQITAWYWLLTILVIGLSIIATAIHQKIFPLIFAGIFGFVLVFGASYLEPALFGWMTATDIILIILSISFMISWAILITLYLYNILRYGEAIK